MAATGFAATTAIASGYAESVSAGLQADAEEKAGKINARILELKAARAIELGDKSAKDLKTKANIIGGQQKAAIAASGVVVDYGSADEIQEETELFSSLDAERLRNNATLEAFGYKFQGQNLQTQAEFNAQALRNKGNNALLTGVLKSGAYAYDAYSTKPKVPTENEKAAAAFKPVANPFSGQQTNNWKRRDDPIA